MLATFPASYGVAHGDQIFDVVFFLVITSVLIQGLTLVPSARWLGVAQANDDATPRTGDPSTSREWEW
ncbi:MAG: hypothetical protein V3R77_07535 [Candidatus Binatia bacterium]